MKNLFMLVPAAAAVLGLGACSDSSTETGRADGGLQDRGATDAGDQSDVSDPSDVSYPGDGGQMTEDGGPATGDGGSDIGPEDAGTPDTGADAGTPDVGTDAGIPYFFIAIHNEPFHGMPNQQQQLADSYGILEQMIEAADQRHIKLTLMFSAQWADYIMADAGRQADFAVWKGKGHEVAAHHHGVFHGGWDGYSGYPKDVALAQRACQGKSEGYLGTLADYIGKLKQLNPDIKAGCANDEQDKTEIPDEIVNDTCSGYSNHQAPGTQESDGNAPAKGKNEFVLAGEYKGIKRNWLAHYQAYQKRQDAEAAFSSMAAGHVYGAVFHSSSQNAAEFHPYLEFLHAKDPAGARSRTVSEVVDQQLLPEQTLPAEFINTGFDACERPDGGVPDGGQPPLCTDAGECPPKAVCCPEPLPCAGKCMPDCREPGQPCPPQVPNCDTLTGLCGP
ncbi:MAG: hypothetical protein HY897_01875 [Deltaproteobacteria bacterium]|nr:hypothetical protein [Deltaproteobacteria bacterium]